jgi:hypothetical protein
MFVAVGFFVAGAGAQAGFIADPGDPEIEIDNLGDATPITTNTFTVSADTAGGGRFSFLNDTNMDWTSITFNVPLQYLPTTNPAAYNCDAFHAPHVSNTFLNCSFTFTSTELVIVFSGVEDDDHGMPDPNECKEKKEAHGVPVGCAFSIELNTTSGLDQGGWLTPNGTPISFDAFANTPEPFLGPPLLAILAVGWSRIRRRGGRSSSFRTAC